jgi:hypothetical protein
MRRFRLGGGSSGSAVSVGSGADTDRPTPSSLSSTSSSSPAPSSAPSALAAAANAAADNDQQQKKPARLQKFLGKIGMGRRAAESATMAPPSASSMSSMPRASRGDSGGGGGDDGDGDDDAVMAERSASLTDGLDDDRRHDRAAGGRPPMLRSMSDSVTLTLESSVLTSTRDDNVPDTESDEVFVAPKAVVQLSPDAPRPAGVKARAQGLAAALERPAPRPGARPLSSVGPSLVDKVRASVPVCAA